MTGKIPNFLTDSSRYNGPSSPQVLQEIHHDANRNFTCGNSKKRRFEEVMIDDDHSKDSLMNTTAMAACRGSKMFISIPCNGHIFDSQSCRSNKTTAVYTPLKEDLLINMRNIEQITFRVGTHFIGNESGEYCSSMEGFVIELYRYSEARETLYVSRSLLVTDQNVYHNIRRHIEDL